MVFFFFFFFFFLGQDENHSGFVSMVLRRRRRYPLAKKLVVLLPSSPFKQILNAYHFLPLKISRSKTKAFNAQVLTLNDIYHLKLQQSQERGLLIRGQKLGQAVLNSRF